MSTHTARKIVDAAALSQSLGALRTAGKTVVQCHGCFDIVHPGHIRYLQFARGLGDVLVVSLTGDGSVGKGPDRPYIPQDLRAENLAALECVDWVVVDTHPTACELLDTLRPDVYVKGREYASATDERFRRECEIVARYGGRVVFHSGDVVFSSTRLLEATRGDEALDEQRLRSYCERHHIDLRAASATAEAFAGLRVVVVGDLMWERYVLCDASGADDGAPILSLQRLGATDHWGGVAAVAAQLRALGARPCVLSAVGRDETSSRLVAGLTELGIDGRYLPVRPSLVEHSTFVADESKVVRLTEGGTAPLDSRAEEQAVGALRELLVGASLLIWCDYGYGMVQPKLMRAGACLARQQGVPVAGYATGQGGNLTGLVETDMLHTTERRLREAMHDMGSSLPAVAYTLLNATHGQTLLVSLRKRGLVGFRRPDGDGAASLHERLTSEFVPCLAPNFVDSLQAEETKLAVAALTLAVGGTLPVAAYLASAAESLAVTRVGGAVAQAHELQAWLARRAELRPRSPFFPDEAALGDIAALAPPLDAAATAFVPGGQAL